MESFVDIILLTNDKSTSLQEKTKTALEPIFEETIWSIGRTIYLSFPEAGKQSRQIFESLNKNINELTLDLKIHSDYNIQNPEIDDDFLRIEELNGDLKRRGYDAVGIADDCIFYDQIRMKLNEILARDQIDKEVYGIGLIMKTNPEKKAYFIAYSYKYYRNYNRNVKPDPNNWYNIMFEGRVFRVNSDDVVQKIISNLEKKKL